ncbi:hypothetical protein LEN26_013901 [Aphanomyces euteiches]|nr:hypothetical protein AeMF1_021530 [Aphanomyces euteiches]KAH9110024.1 hypothetical protein LEN26_013901 [Aphanomyces euteiches]KAH9197704.1 hypothetical protein AeNC1_000348 [Aphanomyces euteiches]
MKQREYATKRRHQMRITNYEEKMRAKYIDATWCNENAFFLDATVEQPAVDATNWMAEMDPINWLSSSNQGLTDDEYAYLRRVLLST